MLPVMGSTLNSKNLEQWFSDFSVHQNHLVGLLKQVPETYSQSFCFSTSGMGHKNLHFFLFFFLINLFIYLFMAVLGLCFCARAFSSCGKRGPLFIAVRGPLTVAASLVAEHRLQARRRRLSSCGSRAHLLRGMWDLPRPGLKPVSPSIGRRILNHCTTREARES